MATDIEMQDAATDAISDDVQDPIHFLVAVDFGTTFSSVAYVGYSHEHQRRHLTMSQIEMVDAFPYWAHRNTPVHDVPTELWYPGPGQQPDGTKRYPDHQQKCWISHAGLGMKAGACAMEHRQVIQPVFSEGRHDGTC